MTAGSTRVPRWPYALLGLMTAFSFGGPVLIVYVVRGGLSPDWPPDRPIEWLTFGFVSGMVLLLMTVCFSLLLATRKAIKQPTPAQADRPGVEP